MAFEPHILYFSDAAELRRYSSLPIWHDQGKIPPPSPFTWWSASAAMAVTPSKAQRSSVALQTAARLAELRRKYYSTAELHEAAASIWPHGNGSGLLRKAEQCRSLVDVDTPNGMDI